MLFVIRDKLETLEPEVEYCVFKHLSIKLTRNGLHRFIFPVDWT